MLLCALINLLASTASPIVGKRLTRFLSLYSISCVLAISPSLAAPEDLHLNISGLGSSPHSTTATCESSGVLSAVRCYLNYHSSVSLLLFYFHASHIVSLSFLASYEYLAYPIRAFARLFALASRHAAVRPTILSGTGT